MKRILKVIARILLIAIVGAIAAPFLLYRVPRSMSVTIKGEILYKFIDIAPPNKQGMFEYVMGNQWIRLVDGNVIYIKPKDFDRIWAENPHDMRKKGYTKYVIFETTPLLFGGYGLSTIKEIKKINKEPVIGK